MNQLFNKKSILFFISLVCFFLPLSSALLSDGSVGHWTFDDGSGTIASDSSTNENKGTLNGPLWTTGKVGSGALQLDGIDDYVSIPDSTSLSSIEGSNQATIAYWIRRDSATATMGIISRWNTGKLVAIYSDSNFPIRSQWRYGGAGTGGTTLDHAGCGNTNCPILAGEWHHVAVIYDNPASYIYLDGQLKHSRNGTGGALNANTSDPLSIGKYSSFHFNGSIDDVRIYNRALSASEVQEVYQLGLDSAPPQQPIAPFNATNDTIHPANTTNATVSDSTPPVRSKGKPSEILQSGTKEINLKLSTDENATCRYSTEPNVPYDAMSSSLSPNENKNKMILTFILKELFGLFVGKKNPTGHAVGTLAATEGIEHSALVNSLEDGKRYKYHIKCMDSLGNANDDDYVVSFSVASIQEKEDEIAEGEIIKEEEKNESPVCELTAAYWGSDEAEKGESVSLLVEGNNCEGKESRFTIYEVDPLTREEVQTYVVNAVMNNGKAETDWNAEWECEVSVFGNCVNNPEYKFVSEVNPVIESNGTLYVVDAVAADCADSRVICVDDTPGQTQENSTIQQCANSVKPGEICLVWPGNYPEHVTTKFGGTSETSRVTFKTTGAVTMQGFYIDHPYITVDGFDITGFTPTLSYEHIDVTVNGNYCEILNNVIRNGSLGVDGIRFPVVLDTGGNFKGAGNCLIRGNTLRNLNSTFLTMFGANHTVLNNTLERLNNRDYIYVFGHGHVFRRNIFRDGNAVNTTGNHPDWVQTFGDQGGESYDMLFEENWIENVEAQLGQLDAGGSGSGRVGNIHDWTFRNNIFINVSNNMNTGVPGIRWEHNTFYRQAYTQSGIGAYGSLARGDASRNIFVNNAFVAGGNTATTNNSLSGFYNLAGAFIDREVFRVFATGVDDNKATAITVDLKAHGYTNGPNGGLFNKARNLTNISQFTMGDTGSFYKPAVYATLALIFPGNISAQDDFYNNYMGANVLPYKPAVYDLLTRTVQLDQSIRSSTVADYNFVAGSAPNYYPKLRTTCPEGIFTTFNFCETHGINGGNPQFKNESDPDGPDNIPFTLDDGLKPLPGSPLCGAGQGGRDIGVYSCDPNTVLADRSPAPSFPISGFCSSTLNTCTTGTPSDVADTSINYLWHCLGSGGGSNASCSLPKNVTDTISPSVSLSAPSNNTNVSGIVTISATASDNIGVIGVQFKVDGVNFRAEDTLSPYSIQWDTTTVALGNHILTAVARDAAGNTANASPVTVTVPQNYTLCNDADRDGLPDYDVNTCSLGTDKCIQSVSNWNAYQPISQVGLNASFNATLNATTQDLRNVSNFTLSQPGKASISFLQRMRIVDVNQTGCFVPLNISKFIQLEDKKVTVRSENFSEFNKPALVRFENVSYITPKLLRDGADCGSFCVIILYNETGKTVIVNVSGFSTYEVVEGFVPPSSNGGQTSSGSGGGGGSAPIRQQNTSTNTTFNQTAPVVNGGEEIGGSESESSLEQPSSENEEEEKLTLWTTIALGSIPLILIALIVLLIHHIWYVARLRKFDLSVD